VRITRVYTRTGDRGTTRLVGGDEVPKDDLRIECYGTVDELNAHVGLVRTTLEGRSESLAPLVEVLESLQHELFDVGADLATPPHGRWEGMHRVGDSEVSRLESLCDTFNETLPPLREFILPGGGPVSAQLHVARTVARRAERITVSLEAREQAYPGCVRYLNRLSDLLFILGRWAAHAEGFTEPTWKQPKDR